MVAIHETVPARPWRPAPVHENRDRLRPGGPLAHGDTKPRVRAHQPEQKATRRRLTVAITRHPHATFVGAPRVYREIIQNENEKRSASEPSLTADCACPVATPGSPETECISRATDPSMPLHAIRAAGRLTRHMGLVVYGFAPSPPRPHVGADGSTASGGCP